MNAYILMEAIGEIDDRYILSAQQKLGLSLLHINTATAGSPPFLAAVITAIAILMSTFTVAFAVSEDFREAVIRFFGIGETVVVPEYTQAPLSVEPEKENFGGLIQGTYVHTPEASLARNGMFYICADDQMLNSGTCFDAYAVEGGALVKLETRTFCQNLRVLGTDFHVEFQWAEHGGVCSPTYVPPEAPYSMKNLSGSPDSVLMTFDCRLDDFFTQYPVLVDLYTGKVTDILAGTKADRLPGICNAAISRDRSKMLLALENNDLYYADLELKKLYSLEDLSGMRPDACAFAGDSLACWALEGASEKERSLGSYRIRTVDLVTLECRELFQSLPAAPATSYDTWSALYEPVLHFEDDGTATERYPDENGNYTLTELPDISFAGLHFLGGFSREYGWGNHDTGSGFAVTVDESRNVFVIDLETGEKSKIENYTWPDVPYPRLQAIPSADGQKLLIYGEKDESKSNDGCISNVGVLDFGEKTYLEFARENRNQVREESIYWFDNQSIIITTSPTREAPGRAEGICDYYIYKLLDN